MKSWLQKYSLPPAAQLFARVDWTLLGLVTLLACIGMLTLYSAADKNMLLLRSQIIPFFLGIIAMISIAQIPTHHLLRVAPMIYGVTCVLLIAVLVIGVTVKGAPRWISLGVIRFQPSELMKLSMPLMLAWFLQQNKLPPNFKTLLICLAIAIIPIFLVLIEPDLGTSIMISLSAISVIILAGMHWGYIVGGLMAIITLMPVAWTFMHQYQKNRVLTFLNPENDPLGTGYHIIQSKIAIGSGGFSGKGWLNGSQGHLHFLPEHTTDFIFSLYGEEFGFVGALGLIMLFILITLRSLAISQLAQSDFAKLLSGSLALSFFLSMVVNIAMVSGLLPVVGVPLPLMSRGGTSMLMWMCFFGMIMSLKNETR